MIESIVKYVTDNWGFLSLLAIGTSGSIVVIKNLYGIINLHLQNKKITKEIKNDSSKPNMKSVDISSQDSIELIPTDVFYSYLNAKSVDITTFLDAVKLELSKHPIFLKIDYESIPLPLKNGYYIVISRLYNKITIESVFKESVKIDIDKCLEKLTNLYFSAYQLAFRKDHMILKNKYEYEKTSRKMDDLFLSLEEYYVGMITHPMFSNFRGLIHRAKGQIALHQIDAQQLYYHYLSPEGTIEDLGQVAICFDLIITSVHKILLDHLKHFSG